MPGADSGFSVKEPRVEVLRQCVITSTQIPIVRISPKIELPSSWVSCKCVLKHIGGAIALIVTMELLVAGATILASFGAALLIQKAILQAIIRGIGSAD